MIFSSITFLVYFLPLCLFFYFIIRKEYRNSFLLIASCIFYSWGAPRFIFAILLTTLADYFLVRQMDKSTEQSKRRLFLVLSVSVNVGLLFYFKYANFFIDNINEALVPLFGKKIKALNVILPIGISFYTFESITYVVDVYRKLHKPLNNFRDYLLYIILFPKLIAGPIIRFHEISDQIVDRSHNDTIDNKILGFTRFCIGLGKKVLIGNTMGYVADQYFNASVSELGTIDSWLAMITYTFQIYFDFSGYSDMAIGLGLMFGFKFPENFNNPYTAKSITDFWRRWHMTLGNWMRNYLYIPLGGNRVDSKFRIFFNLWLVFLASGFWHGAAWTFIIWGVFHGIMLILEKAFLLKVYDRLGPVIPILITFLLVNIGWVFFRADTLGHASEIIKNLFIFKESTLALDIDNRFIFFLVIAFVFSFFTLIYKGQAIQDHVYFEVPSARKASLLMTAGMLIFVISLSTIATSSFNPFIYFRF